MRDPESVVANGRTLESGVAWKCLAASCTLMKGDRERGG
jgi:hypothetical protein